jgi:hypothetical protein
MKENRIPNFREFNKSFKEIKVEEGIGTASRKLQKATEEFHNAQLDLQNLQKQFVGMSKEDSNRESMKQSILNQHKIVKQKEALFAKALGDEDIEDLEI